jgi:hypothetical protein
VASTCPFIPSRESSVFWSRYVFVLDCSVQLTEVLWMTAIFDPLGAGFIITFYVHVNTTSFFRASDRLRRQGVDIS